MRLTIGMKNIEIVKGKISFLKVFSKINYKINLRSFMRFMYDKFRGYYLYYFYLSGKPIGFLLLVKGGGRYSFSQKTDFVISPIYIMKEHRGNRYADILIKNVLSIHNKSTIYAIINKDNLASIKLHLRNDFIFNSNVFLNKAFKWKLGKSNINLYKLEGEKS